MQFMAYKQAYDSIIRERLWKAMEELEVPAKLVRIIKMWVKCLNVYSSSMGIYQVCSGLKRG